MFPPTTPVPDRAAAAVLLNGAIGQIRFARSYTRSLLEETPADRWFEIPEGHSSCVAWQVGHLTVSQYGLLMFRLRGRRPDDLDLIPGKFRKAYSRQTVPSCDFSRQPTPEELLSRFRLVHERAIEELQQTDPDVLLEDVDLPWALWPIKLGAILFCPLHEHIHAGQIGTIRRGLGLDPVR